MKWVIITKNVLTPSFLNVNRWFEGLVLILNYNELSQLLLYKTTIYTNLIYTIYTKFYLIYFLFYIYKYNIYKILFNLLFILYYKFTH